MSVFDRTYDIKREIRLLHLELQTIEGIKQLTQFEGWVGLKDFLLTKIVFYDRELSSLCNDPVGNADKIRAKNSMKQAFVGLLTGIDNTLDAETEIRRKLFKLEKTAEQADLLAG